MGFFEDIRGQKCACGERETFSDVLCLEVSDPLAMCPDISVVRDPPHPLSILLLRVIKLERLPVN